MRHTVDKFSLDKNILHEWYRKSNENKSYMISKYIWIIDNLRQILVYMFGVLLNWTIIRALGA